MPAGQIAKFNNDGPVYNGGEGKEHEIAIISSQDDDIDDATGITNLLVFDSDGNGNIKENVPYRSPKEPGYADGAGHTWHWNSDKA